MGASLVLMPVSARTGQNLEHQVQIEAKLVEVSQSHARELGFDTMIAQKLGQIAPDASKPSADVIGAALFPSNGTPGTLSSSGVFTAPQFQIVLDALGREKGAKVFSAPTLATPGDQKAFFRINSSIPTQGCNIEILPRIGEDGATITLTIVPQLQSPQAQGTTNQVSLSTGQTVALGGLVSEGTKGEHLILFITPRIINVLAGGSEATGWVNIETIGTGETIGHIADFKIQNLTDQAFSFFIRPLILESQTGKSQDYACTHGQDVVLGPKETKIVPVDGVCLERGEPPAGKGVTGGFIMNMGDPSVPENRDSHLHAKQTRDLLHIAESKYDAADKLERDGGFKDFPYKDKQKQKDIVVQWSIWSDARISEITGDPPATKEDLRKVVNKQVEEQGPVTPDTKKKVDKGIDTIFEKIELTTAKAKGLEEPDQYPEMPPGAINVSDNTPTPAPLWKPKFPGTKEKPMFRKLRVPKPDWPKPIQRWVDQKSIADMENKRKEAAHQDYARARWKFFQKSKHHQELDEQSRKAFNKFNGSRTPEDKANSEKLDKELKALEGELEKDFLKTPEGQAEYKKMTTVDKAADEANAAEKEAGKDIDQATKDSVEKTEAERKAAEAAGDQNEEEDRQEIH
jgi:hypothetical protein